MSEQHKDSSTDSLILMFLFAGVIMAITYFYGEAIKNAYLTIKLVQLKILNAIIPIEYFSKPMNFIEKSNPKNIDLDYLKEIGKRAGLLFNVPAVLILGYYGYNVWKKNPLNKFKRILTMQSLKESEQRLWPYISPMVNVQLIKEPFDKGPYAMALTPYDFAVKYHLLKEEKKVDSLDMKKAEKLFVSQLGRPFNGFDKLKSHEKALVAIFAANGLGDKDGAMKAINEIAKSAALVGIKKMPDFSSAKPLYKYCEDPRVLEVFSKHAYIYTLMAQMLEFARGTGVFAPPYFIWLKPRDRTLWYTLNCVGRQVAFVEVAGIFGHWRAEQTAGHKLDAPYVKKAVDGLEKALLEVKVT